VLLGFATLFYLTDRPDQAKWLTERERDWLTAELARERLANVGHHRHTLVAALSEPRVWLLIAIYFTVAVGDNVYGFYIPKFLKTQFADWTPTQIGFLAAAPSVLALFGMYLVGRHSDRTGERKWHVACCAFTASVGWLTIAFAPSPTVFVIGLAVTTLGLKSMLPTFWTLPGLFLSGEAAAGGVALINSVANLGGYFGPRIIGWTRAENGSFFVGFLIMSGVLLTGGILTLCLRTTPREST
jgi:ACS family tartrate transporter-like MFS transporter